MTHEPIHTVHLTPHITWQGTQAELEAMQKEGWPLINASEIIAACKRDAVEAEAYAEELEAKLAKNEAMMQAGFAEYERRLAKAGEVKEAQQFFNHCAVEVLIYGATVDRLKALGAAWVNLQTQSELAELKGDKT